MLLKYFLGAADIKTKESVERSVQCLVLNVTKKTCNHNQNIQNWLPKDSDYMH